MNFMALEEWEELLEGLVYAMRIWNEAVVYFNMSSRSFLERQGNAGTI